MKEERVFTPGAVEDLNEGEGALALEAACGGGGGGG